MAMFGPLMQDNPILTFTEACARMTRQSLKVVKEL
jgi:hypothetical protein